MANNRIFYACQAVGLKPIGSTTGNYKVAHGVQSVGVTTNFNLEQAFEHGQIQIYENIEGLPDVECTMEKVIDGYPLLYHLASQDAISAGLVGRSKRRADVALGIFSDEQDSVNNGDGNGKTQTLVYMSGMYINSISYTVPVDGNATESVTLVGNHKEWAGVGEGGAAVFAAADDLGYGALGSPESAPSGVQRRQMLDVVNSTFPAEVRRAASDGGLNATVADRKVHINSISCSADLGREEIRELGRKGPYFRYITFPLEVSSEFEVTATSGDFVNAFEEGRSSDKSNLTDRTIKFKLDDGTRIELGAKNKLNSVSYGGGDTGGGNSTITYSYSTFNDFKVFHGQDPAAKTS